ncbi:HlyD family efflux transporter periplasmic adaptor subunit [Novosphingobium sp.]|uniref:HlyD family secretion protein n=1 Tax=Novosphingobium sp. TaxID=1874826 RepID=UPI00261550F9|nr:HlyD family efflux transporter periplasmic adaptor subunit [Novosphingobium sp.]
MTGRVVVAVPPRSWHYTGLSLAALVVAVLLLVLGNYSSTAEVRGLVAYSTGVSRIYPQNTGQIGQIFVRPGDRVNAGQPIAELIMAQGPGGMNPQLQQLGKQDAELGRQIALTEVEFAAQLASLQQKGAAIGATIASYERQRVIAREQVRLAESAARRARKLASEQAATQRQVEDANSVLLSRRAELEAIEEQISAQRNARAVNLAEQAQLRTGSEKSRSVIAGQRAALGSELQALSRANRITLVAPVAGTVGDIAGEVGQPARPEVALATIIPANGKLEVWLYAPTRAVGHAAAGQQVRLHFDAFPYETYGTGLGIISAIAEVPTDPGYLDPGLKIQEPVFRIRASLARFAPHVRQGAGSLRPGMTLTGKIITERRSLWTVLFGSLRNGSG